MVKKLVKSSHLLFIFFSLPNWHYSSIVQWLPSVVQEIWVFNFFKILNWVLCISHLMVEQGAVEACKWLTFLFVFLEFCLGQNVFYLCLLCFWSIFPKCFPGSTGVLVRRAVTARNWSTFLWSRPTQTTPFFIWSQNCIKSILVFLLFNSC